MRFKSFFSRPYPYLGWIFLSALGLFAAERYDPYVFGFTAFGTLGVSSFLTLVSLFLGWRSFLLAALGFSPTAIAFAVLSTYHWA